jgi:hypothetical protein
MIWLLALLLPLSRQQVVSLSLYSCESSVELTDGRGGGWVGGELTGIATPSRVYLIDMGNEGRARDSRTP